MVVDLAVAQQAEQPLDFLVADGAAEADAVNVTHWNEDGRVVGDDAEMKEAAGGAENRLVFDPFNDSQTMIRVNDLVTDLKCHRFPPRSAVWKAKKCTGSPLSIPDEGAEYNGNGRKTLFLRI